MPQPTRVAIIGAGAVGTALARRLAPVGYTVRAIISRHEASAEQLAENVGGAQASTDLSELPADVRLVLLCIPDDALPEVAAALRSVDHDWPSTYVAHTSGVHTAEVLEPLAEEGATALSFHPIQSFTTDTSPAIFEDTIIGVEGKPEAVAFGAQLARDLGARHVTVPTSAKAQVHLAATVASNGLVALMAVVSEILETANINVEEHSTLIRPLVERTWQNLLDSSPEVVLTGPVARADQETIALHLETLDAHLPHLKPAYAALVNEMVRTAVRGGKITAEDADIILDQLHESIQTDEDTST